MNEVTLKAVTTEDHNEARISAQVLTGIIYYIWRNGWKEGVRNDMTCDFFISRGVFGSDEQWKELKETIIALVNSDDQAVALDDAYERAFHMEDYVDGYVNMPCAYYCNMNLWIDEAAKAIADTDYHGPIFKVED